MRWGNTSLKGRGDGIKYPIHTIALSILCASHQFQILCLVLYASVTCFVLNLLIIIGKMLNYQSKMQSHALYLLSTLRATSVCQACCRFQSKSVSSIKLVRCDEGLCCPASLTRGCTRSRDVGMWLDWLARRMRRLLWWRHHSLRRACCEF